MKTTNLVQEARSCRFCEAHLPLGPRPVFQVHPQAVILIIGQAPGLKVHQTGIPWNDSSGDRLRQWMGIDRANFYNQRKIGILPMGFCYPGKGVSGDLPPRSECAPLWHPRLTEGMSKIRLRLVLGRYAQEYYLASSRGENLTGTVRAWKTFLPHYLPLPHPSPRNFRWMAKNRWFEEEVIPFMRSYIPGLLNGR